MSGPPTNSSFIQVTPSNPTAAQPQHATAGSVLSSTPSPPRPQYSVQQQQQQQVKVVAGYALQQKLGSGSFAVVYKGVRLPQYESQHPQTQPQAPNEGVQETAAETVAIKAIARTSEKLTKKVLQNLEVEISILRTYRHRNIVCLQSVQKTERHFYLILEYCGGGDLQRLIRTRQLGRLSEGLARRLMRDLASGLKFLWSQELIHRDLKPQNLLLTGPVPLDEVNDPELTPEQEEIRRQANFPSPQFVLKIADFGFARHLQTASLAETLCGSPLYMAPEILQHHRYDAKADLWSVGTVLFEMISGHPPFHGENHMDLLRNIQRKAVRLPADVRVSKECVKLLRLLLNRNPLCRAGFAEFFEAADAFVALGCNGIPTPSEEGTLHHQRPSMDLGTIPENDGSQEPSGTAESMLTVATTAAHAHPQETQNQQQPQQPSYNTQGLSKPQAIPDQSGALTKMVHNSNPSNNRVMLQQQHQSRALAPLVPSPPTSNASPIYAAMAAAQQQMYSNVQASHQISATNQQQHAEEQNKQLQQYNPQQQSQQSGDNAFNEENSFVMVEHGSMHLQKSLSTSGNAAALVSSDIYRQQQDLRPRLEQPPTSTYFLPGRNPIMNTRSDYMVVKPPKGMLSTSPGTGGALMGMLTGARPRITSEANINNSSTAKQQLEAQITATTKMMAAAEDVGRRAISVAHLGDNRAYVAMRLVMMNDNSSSSLLYATPMEGIEEENADHDSGAVTDDSSSTEIMASFRRRRRSSSATDKSMPDATKAATIEEEVEEMPFALQSESPPVISAGMPSRAVNLASVHRGTSITMARPPVKPTPAMIRSHFSEALSCYVKALRMLKGALGAAQRVAKDLEMLASQRLSNEQRAHIQRVEKRYQVTSNWLGGQFKGVLERGDAATVEISKLPNNPSEPQIPVMSVEELIYNHSLASGREGAVKQLLGHYEAARFCYRSAGLLAETLLMEANIGNDDRKTLEDYVDGFAARITELDEVMLQQSRLGTGSTAAVSTQRGPAVVSLIGQSPALGPSISLGAHPVFGPPR